MSEDRSLCPVRVLWLYLDRSKQLKAGKHLLFVALGPKFAKDIARSTISHWIKHTIKFCYESADDETLKLNRVKAHDVRALSASFKGVSL